MNGFGKVMTAILGIIAVIACLGTVAIIGYSFMNNNDKPKVQSQQVNTQDRKLPVDEAASATAVPTTTPRIDESVIAVPTAIDPNHIHDYKPLILKKATCYEAGQARYECVCGDYYVVDLLSTGHVPDEWEIIKEPTEDTPGQKVRRCIYCDEVIASETISTLNAGGDGSNKAPKHEHLYAATTEREPTCTLAGLRKHTCSCGNFYTEGIPAIGHVAKDWDNVVPSTETAYGTSQRMCSVCGALLDTKVLLPLSPSPSASPSDTSSASASSTAAASGSPAASASAQPSKTPESTPTPHVHNFTSYIVTMPTCTTKGVRSYICSCGSSYAESIDLDLNFHTFRATFVAPTDTQQGYTVYTCKRCNYSYKDNYLLPLTNQGDAAATSPSPTPTPTP